MATKGKKKQRPIDLPALQTKAMEHVQDFLHSTVIPVGELSEENYKRCMDTIVQGLVNAWAAGYMQGREDA